jgi:ankyrin repeat protein
MNDINQKFLEVVETGNLRTWEQWNTWETIGDPTTTNHIGDNALHIAVYNRRMQNLQFLVESQRFNINTKNKAGQTAITLVALDNAPNAKTVDMMLYLLAHNAQFGKEVLFFAAKWNYSLLEHCITHRADGVDLNASDGDGNTLLHIAAVHSQLESMQLLIKQGIAINAKNIKEQTAITLAAVYWRHNPKMVDSIRCLLAHNAQFGKEVLFFAAKWDYSLLDHCITHRANEVDLNARDGNGNTLLHIAAVHSQLESMHLLIQQGIAINAKNMKEQTAIRLVVSCKKNANQIAASIYCLLAHTAQFGKEVLFFAAKWDYNLLRYCIAHRADEVDLNARDKSGNTLLHIAAACGQIESVQLLIQQGVAINAKNNMGQTPAIFAALYNEPNAKTGDSIRHLLERKAQFGKEILFFAAKWDYNLLRYCVAHRADEVNLNARDENGCTLFHQAVFYKGYSADCQFDPFLKLLKTLGLLGINRKDSDNRTALAALLRVIPDTMNRLERRRIAQLLMCGAIAGRVSVHGYTKGHLLKSRRIIEDILRQRVLTKGSNPMLATDTLCAKDVALKLMRITQEAWEPAKATYALNFHSVKEIWKQLWKVEKEYLAVDVWNNIQLKLRACPQIGRDLKNSGETGRREDLKNR